MLKNAMWASKMGEDVQGCVWVVVDSRQAFRTC